MGLFLAPPVRFGQAVQHLNDLHQPVYTGTVPVAERNENPPGSEAVLTTIHLNTDARPIFLTAVGFVHRGGGGSAPKVRRAGSDPLVTSQGALTGIGFEV